ncbi:beta-glucosidase, partial [Phenoliferia sp. Uapishka_3]
MRVTTAPQVAVLLALLSSLACANNSGGYRFPTTPNPAPPGYEEYTSPFVYPSPNTTGTGDWASAVAKAREFVSDLSIEELVNMTTGAGILGRCVGNTGSIPRKNFAGFCLEDSPVGVRFTDFASAFPAGINSASTWDRDLIRKRGEAMGAEHRGKVCFPALTPKADYSPVILQCQGVNVALGPMMNLGRVAAGGRNWEGAGGDPYFAGVVSAETIIGIQSQGVIACAKHFVGNEQEHYRGGGGATASSSNISWPFAASVKAGVGSVMCSYQHVNQTFACENSKILNGILKDEFDFQGFVVSDWAALESGVLSALAGADMDMPGFYAYGNPNQPNPSISNTSYWGAALVESVKNGSVPLYRVQDMVTRTMAAYYKMGQDSFEYPKVNFDQLSEDTYIGGVLLNEHVDVQADHAKLIREIGAASTVMLKNERFTLPLAACDYKRYGIFGSDAGQNPDGPNSCVDRGCDSGTLAMGWGSGSANFPYRTSVIPSCSTFTHASLTVVDPLSAIQTFVHSQNPTAVVEGMTNDYNYFQAQAVARQADICLVFVNADSGEGYITVDTNAGDRNNLTLWHEGDALIANVTSQCDNTVVVIHAVGPVIMEAWVNNPNVTAILWASLPGQETGNAIVDILFGGVNPSARLPYTIAKERKDYPADILYTSYETVPQITYSEKLLIDYRWYGSLNSRLLIPSTILTNATSTRFDAHDIAPRFEFGFGLSYTTFAYSNIEIKAPHSRRMIELEKKWNSPSDLHSVAFTVTFTVENAGSHDGNEVSQLYIGFPASAEEPPKVLRGFERTYLKKGCSAEVSMSLTKKDISIWSVVEQAWVVPSGSFEVMIGQSSRMIVLTQSFMR